MRGETGHSQREKNIQSRRDNKGRTKDDSRWQDAPGASLLLLCWKGVAELQCGAIKRPEDGVGEGPGMITHPGCAQIREKKKKRSAALPVMMQH